MFVPESLFGLNRTLKLIILSAVFLTLFLLLFLLLNIKQEPALIVSERIKKLQLHLLWEHFERKQEIDWKRIKNELEGRREEVKQEILRGIGKVKKEEHQRLESLLDKSWDEILTVLGGKAAESQAPPPVDINRLAELIEKALKNIGGGGALLPGSRVSEARPVPSKPAEVPEHAGTEEGELQEAEEEVEEVEEVEEAEEVEELEPVEELEEVKEVEPIEEAEEAEELEPVEIGPVDETLEEEPAEELEELEPTELEEVEPIELASTEVATEELEAAELEPEVLKPEEPEVAELETADGTSAIGTRKIFQRRN